MADTKTYDAYFVLDFGLPIIIEPKDINSDLANSEITSATATITSEEFYGEFDCTDPLKIKFTPAKTIDGITEATITYAGNTSTSYNIRILPASNVYYEERFFEIDEANKDKWTPVYGVNTSTSRTDAQATEKLGESSNYGYDAAYKTDATYSGGSAYRAVVDTAHTFAERPTATFTFEGTGFDIVSECANNTGMLYVRVGDKDNKYEKSYLVDTYLNGDSKNIIANGDTTYQIPVVRCTDVLKYGTHIVTVSGFVVESSGAVMNNSTYAMNDYQNDAIDNIYMALADLGVTDEELDSMEFVWMDENSILNGGTGASVYSSENQSGIFNSNISASYTTGNSNEATSSKYYVYIDGFRVYNPLGTSDQNYILDNQQNFNDINISQAIASQSIISDSLNVYGFILTDQQGIVLEDPKKYTQSIVRNEIKLYPNQCLAFNIKSSSNSTKIHLLIKSTYGNCVATLSGATFESTGTNKLNLTTSTEMPYTIIPDSIIQNDDGTYSTGLITISNGVEDTVLSVSVLRLINSAVTTDISSVTAESTDSTSTFIINKNMIDEVNQMASINEDIVLGKHLRAALAAVAAKLNLKANASDVITKSSAQTLTDEEKKQARDNIGAGTSSFSGDYKDLTNQPSAVLYTAQALTDAQKAQVRANIGAGASSFSGNYSDLQNVPTKLSDFTNDQGFATTTEVATAIAGANHAKFEVVTSIPTAADAKENILYLFKNTDTGYYDIYAKIGSAVERLDDVSVDLSNYSTTEQVNAAITTATDSVLKYTAQTLTDDQKTQVLTNLGIEFVTDQQVTDMLTELGLTTA